MLRNPLIVTLIGAFALSSCGRAKKPLGDLPVTPQTPPVNPEPAKEPAALEVKPGTGLGFRVEIKDKLENPVGNLNFGSARNVKLVLDGKKNLNVIKASAAWSPECGQTMGPLVSLKLKDGTDRDRNGEEYFPGELEAGEHYFTLVYLTEKNCEAMASFAVAEQAAPVAPAPATEEPGPTPVEPQPVPADPIPGDPAPQPTAIPPAPTPVPPTPVDPTTQPNSLEAKVGNELVFQMDITEKLEEPVLGLNFGAYRDIKVVVDSKKEHNITNSNVTWSPECGKTMGPLVFLELNDGTSRNREGDEYFPGELEAGEHHFTMKYLTEKVCKATGTFLIIEQAAP